MKLSTTFSFATICFVAACGGPGFQEPERAAPWAEPELTLGSIALLDPERGEPLIALREDGAIEHAHCAFRLEPNGDARDERSGLVLRVEGDAMFARDGSVLFRLDATQLIRGDGESARLEGDQIVFGTADALSVRVRGADSPLTKRTALVLFALLGVCGQ